MKDNIAQLNFRNLQGLEVVFFFLVFIFSWKISGTSLWLGVRGFFAKEMRGVIWINWWSKLLNDRWQSVGVYIIFFYLDIIIAPCPQGSF